MFKNLNFMKVFGVIVIIFLFLNGCKHPIKYGLNPRDILISKEILPMKVAVIEFTDIRPQEEREKSSREEKGFSDIGDYTYDKNFKGEVAEAITTMLIDHLRYAKIFSEVKSIAFAGEGLSKDNIDVFKQKGFDAVIVGKIKNFYGYYDRNVAREFIFMLPGLASAIVMPSIVDPYSFSESLVGVLVEAGILFSGTYLETLVKRDIEWKTELHVRLIQTSTSDAIWEDTFQVFGKVHKNMPGLGAGNKYKVAVNSFRDAVNKMVKSLSQSPPPGIEKEDS